MYSLARRYLIRHYVGVKVSPGGPFMHHLDVRLRSEPMVSGRPGQPDWASGLPLTTQWRGKRGKADPVLASQEFEEFGFDSKGFEEKMGDAVEGLEAKLAKLRSGVASPDLLDGEFLAGRG